VNQPESLAIWYTRMVLSPIIINLLYYKYRSEYIYLFIYLYLCIYIYNLYKYIQLYNIIYIYSHFCCLNQPENPWLRWCQPPRPCGATSPISAFCKRRQGAPALSRPRAESRDAVERWDFIGLFFWFWDEKSGCHQDLPAKSFDFTCQNRIEPAKLMFFERKYTEFNQHTYCFCMAKIWTCCWWQQQQHLWRDG
jgi:hypothetical protein